MYSEYVEVVIRFITAINSHTIDSIVSLISEDHKFTDSLGNIFRGRETMKKGWTDYFHLFPDYKIEIDEIYSDENKIMLIGKAGGTYSIPSGELLKENIWKINVAWRALVIENKIKEWQVFGDNKVVFEILERNKK